MIAFGFFDSGVSSHMSSTLDLFTRLFYLFGIKSVSIVNDCHCSVFGEDVVPTISKITFDKVLYVSDFQ